jgi:hypothetical protein
MGGPSEEMRRLCPSLPDRGRSASEYRPPLALLQARLSVSFIFFANGFVVASWLPHIPEVKERLALSDFRLGVALFAMAVGSVLALPFAGWLVGRLGSDAATRTAGLALCILLPFPVLAPSLPALMGSLLLFGAANGMLDVSMNAQAVALEDCYRKPILASLHGLYSTGGLAGASLATVAAAGDIPTSSQVLALTVILAPTVFVVSRHLLSDATASDGGGPMLAWPSGALIGLGALAFFALMAEGAMGDWTAVFLREYHGASLDAAATGFAGFSLAMAMARFSGDWARRRWKAPNLLRAGGIAAGTGMAMALTVPTIFLSVCGFTLFGLGLANMVPIVFAAAGRAPGMTAGLAIAAVATAGYGGLLAGPPLIGIAAEVVGLRLAFVTILLGVLAIAAFAAIVHQSPNSEGVPG